MSVAALFEPFACKSLTLRNRVVMAPMTRGFSPGGAPTSEVAAYYARRAAGEAGLIVTEGTGINRPASLNGANFPRFHGTQELDAWKTVVDAVHTAGGKISPQLWHVGAVQPPYGDGPSMDDYESPSGLTAPEKPYGKVMSDADIADTIVAFGKAAADAKRLGFDAADLHGAHGYLIDQFFWEGTNRIEGNYGGRTIGERTRFAAEVVREVRTAVGAEFPIIMRLSQWKQQDFEARLATTPDQMTEWLQPMVDAGVDIFHCSQRRFWEPEFEGSDLNFAGWAKKLTGLPTITVGSVGLTGEFMAAYGGEGSKPVPLDDLMRRLERGDFDLVAVGRALLQDPEWIRKVREGRSDELMDFEASAFGSLS